MKKIRQLFFAFLFLCIYTVAFPGTKAAAADTSVLSVTFPSNLSIDVGSPSQDSAATGVIKNNNSNEVAVSFLGIKSTDGISPKVVDLNETTGYWTGLNASLTESQINLGFNINGIKYWSPAQTVGSPTAQVGDILYFLPGTSKTITPIAHHGNQWSKDASLNYMAYFKVKQYYTISASGANGTVSGTGSYLYGDNVTLTAVPNSNYRFASWSDGVTTATRTITVTGDTSLTANFSLNSFTVTLSAGAGGTVSGSGTYTYGQTVTLTATPDTGYSFQSWSDKNTNATRTVTVTDNISLTASFKINSYTVNAYTDGGGTVSGSGTYTHGQEITITASAATGYDFARWSDGNTNATRNLTVTGDTDLKAYFSIHYYTVTANNIDYYDNTNQLGSVRGCGSYPYGSKITLSAVSNNDPLNPVSTTYYSFKQWDDGSTNSNKEITVTSNMSVTAKFEKDLILKSEFNNLRMRIKYHRDVYNEKTGSSSSSGGTYTAYDFLPSKPLIMTQTMFEDIDANIQKKSYVSGSYEYYYYWDDQADIIYETTATNKVLYTLIVTKELGSCYLVDKNNVVSKIN